MLVYIQPHQDGPAYFPVVAIVSLESPVVMNFTPHPTLKVCSNTFKDNIENQCSSGECFLNKAGEWKDNHHPFSVLLMPRSLVIFKDDAYSSKVHLAVFFVNTQYSIYIRIDKLMPYTCIAFRVFARYTR